MSGETKRRNGEESLAWFDERAHECREHSVALAQLKIQREQITECYQREGVNHYENCAELVKAYNANLKDGKIGGAKWLR